MFSKFLNKDFASYGKDYAKEVISGLKYSLGIDEASQAKDIYKKSLHSDTLSGLLPYLGYDKTSQLFLLDKGEKPSDKKDSRNDPITGLGFCLETFPQTGGDNSMESILQSIYIQSPSGTTISIHNYASPDVMPKLKTMARMRYTDREIGVKKEKFKKRNQNVFQKMTRKRINYYLSGVSKPLFDDAASLLIRDFRVVISVVVPINGMSNEGVEKAILLREQIKSTLTSANFPSFQWRPIDLINFVSDFFDHSRAFHIPSKIIKEYSDYLPIRNQITDKGIESVVTANEINFNTVMSKNDSSIIQLSVSQYPKTFHVAMMSSLIGDYFQASLAYPCPFMITTSAVVQDYDTMRQKAALKTASSSRKTEGYFAKIDPLIMEEATEWREALKAIDDGGTLIQVSTSITLITKTKHASKAKSEVTAIWRAKGFRLSGDKYQQLVGFLSCMPMALTSPFVKDLRKMNRFSTKYSQNAISLSPLIGEWKGSGTPVMIFFGRRGQLVSLDLFDNNAGNFNFAIVGASGSGKSYFTQELLLSYRANRAKIWVIDVGRSYENICRMLDGDFIEFTDKAGICINPFTHIQDLNDEMDMLKPLIGTMMGVEETLPSWERSIIEAAIKEVFSKLDTKMTITDLSLHLAKEGEIQGDSRIKDMSTKLFPWTKDGAYGQFFEGEANISFTNNFTVLELEELKSKKELQTVVMMLMMYRISQEMYLSRDRKKIVMIDEAWSVMGDGGDSQDFIETGYRRARKYGGAFGTATQNYGDYYKSAGARAALQNADWTFTLRQKEDSINVLEKNGLLGLKGDPFRKRTLLDLKMVAGKYSEVYVHYPEGSGVVRFLSDPFSQMLFSSSHYHFEAIQKYKSRGYDIGEAVSLAMKDFNLKDVEDIPYE